MPRRLPNSFHEASPAHPSEVHPTEKREEPKIITKTSLQLAFYIAKTREEMKLSQTQLSKKTGITQCDISRIEGGVANPTIETLSRICEALNLEIKVCKTQKI